MILTGDPDTRRENLCSFGRSTDFGISFTEIIRYCVKLVLISVKARGPTSTTTASSTYTHEKVPVLPVVPDTGHLKQQQKIVWRKTTKTFLYITTGSTTGRVI
jgi:hypothetical protein